MAIALWLVTLLGGIAFMGVLARIPVLPTGRATPLKAKIVLPTDSHVVVILLVSLLAPISSFGMYTFLAQFIATAEPGLSPSVTPYLWI